jgi:hypothetical protein
VKDLLTATVEFLFFFIFYILLCTCAEKLKNSLNMYFKLQDLSKGTLNYSNHLSFLVMQIVSDFSFINLSVLSYHCAFIVHHHFHATIS